MHKQIKFIYFDVGGVILNWRIGLEKLSQKHRISHIELMKVFRKVDERACKGLLSHKELEQYYKNGLKLKGKTDNIINYWIDNEQSIDQTHELIFELSKSYQIGLLTNVGVGIYDKIFKRKLIPDINYHTVIKSCDLGLAKPDLNIYHQAHKKSKVKHEEILFIDDMEINLVPARKLGWHTVLFDEKSPQISVAKVRQALEIK